MEIAAKKQNRPFNKQSMGLHYVSHTQKELLGTLHKQIPQSISTVAWLSFVLPPYPLPVFDRGLALDSL